MTLKPRAVPIRRSPYWTADRLLLLALVVTVALFDVLLWIDLWVGAHAGLHP